MSAIIVLSDLTCDKTNVGPETDSLVIHFIIKDASYQDFADGSVDLGISGGVPPYAVLWSTGDTTEDIDHLLPGNYSVIVTDYNGTTAMDTAVINSANAGPEDSLVIHLIIKDASYQDVADGSVDLGISGGMPPYAVLWSTGDTTEDIDHLLPGIYSVIVTDYHGVTVMDTAAVNDAKLIAKDTDGNMYNIITIGDQVWMRENLRVTHAPDSSPVESYCYNNDPVYAQINGRLYTWDVAMNGSVNESTRGICPEGWHLPSDEEWKQLERFLGMTRSEADMVNTWRGTGVGSKLGYGGSSGYDALYSGRRSSEGTYSLLGDYEYIWTSTEYGDCAWRRCLSKSANDVGRWNTFPKTYAFSVRCVRDD